MSISRSHLYALTLRVFVISLAIIAVLAAPFLVLLLPSMDPGTWMIVPAIFVGLVAVIIFALINCVVTTFTSTTWTLAYRELTGYQAPLDAGEPEG